MSVEETRGRIDCGTQGAAGAVNPDRFRGVRIFDISDLDNPVQLPGVQTCRGSHTHTLVTDPDDPANVYVYNSGTSGVRSPLELAGCENAALTQAPVTTGNPTQWRIDVIRVPLAAPETAAVVSQPRIFTDPATGAFNGLQNTLPRRAAPLGDRLLAAPEHQHVPRRHGLPRQAARRGRLPGQRHPPRRQRPGEPGAPRRRVRPELLLLALGDLQQRRHEGDLHRRVGRRHVRPLPRHRPAPVGRRRNLRRRGPGRWSSRATTRCRRSRPPRRTASRTTCRWCPCRVATSSCRPGTRAACRSSTSATRPTRSRSATSTAARSTPRTRRAQPRRAVVDLLVQRPGLRQRDRPGVRHLRPRPERPAQRERDRRGAGGRARRVQRPAPGHDDLGAELRGGGCLLRPGGRARASSREDGRRAPPGSSRTRRGTRTPARDAPPSSVLLEAADALPGTGDLGELQQALRDLAATLG